MQADSLEIKIQSSATQANNELDKMITKLGTFQSKLTSMETTNLDSISTSVSALASSLGSISADDSANLNSIKNSINSLSKVSTTNLLATATSISQIVTAINKTGDVGNASVSITTYASAISKLGGANATRAVSNIPILSNSLQQMVTELSGLNSISDSVNSTITSVTNLSSAISKLGGSTATKAITNLPLLATNLKALITELNSLGNVNSTVVNLVANLASLSSQGAKVGTSARSMSTYISSANSKLSLFNKTAKTSTSLTTSLASQIGKLYAAYFWITRIVSAVASAISSAMDYVETYNYFDVVTDKISQESQDSWEEMGYESAEAYASSFKDRMNDLTLKMTGFEIGDNGELNLTDSIGLGMNAETVMAFQAQVLSITNAVGLLGEASTDTATALTMLAGDMSSLYNQDLEDVMDNLISGMVGQSRTLYAYGIDITTATLETYALAEGISKSVSEMTQAEKMQLRLLAILDQSSVSWGDLANTVDTAANQYRIFQERVSALATTIGSLFVNALKVVLPYMTAFVIVLQRLFYWIGNLLGVDWSETLAGLNSGSTDTGLESLSDDVDDVTTGLDDATDAASSLNKQLSSFHELNNLSSDTSTSSDSDYDYDSGIDLSGAISDALDEYMAIWDEAFANMENDIDELENKIQSFFTNVWTAITPFREAIVDLWDNGLSLLASFTWTALEDFYNNFLVPIGKWAFGTEDKGFTRLVNIINEDLMNINWSALNKSLADFWTAIEPYAESFGEGLITFMEDVLDIGVDAVNWLPNQLDNLTNALNNGNPKDAENWGYALGQLAVGLVAIKALTGVGATILSIALGLEKLEQLGVLKGIQNLSVMIGNPLTSLSGLMFLSGISTIITNLSTVISFFSSMNPAAIGSLIVPLEQLTMGTWLDTNTWKGLPAIINSAINSAIDSIGKNLTNAVVELFSTLFNFDSTLEIFELSVSFFENAFKAFEERDWASIGNNIIKGILARFLGEIGFIVEPIGDFFVSFFEAICNVFGIHSPATEMEVIGENIFLGIIEGFTSLFGNFGKSMEEFFTTYVAPWFTAEKWSELATGIQEGISLKWEEFKTWWSETALVTWWNTNVAPWFTYEKWYTLFSTIKTSIETKWNEIVSWWTVALPTWWNTNVAPWFTYEKWETLVTTIYDSIKQKFTDTVDWWQTTITSWWNDDVQPYFSAKTWLQIGSDMKDNLISGFEGVANGVIGILNNVISGLESLLNKGIDGINSMIDNINSLASTLNLPTVSTLGSISLGRIATFSTGGFPEDGLFMANSTELVGQFSNGKTAVVNNSQIITGISQGVSSANDGVISALMTVGTAIVTAINNGSTIEIDGQELFSVVKNESYEYKKQYGEDAFA